MTTVSPSRSTVPLVSSADIVSSRSNVDRPGRPLATAATGDEANLVNGALPVGNSQRHRSTRLRHGGSRRPRQRRSHRHRHQRGHRGGHEEGGRTGVVDNGRSDLARHRAGRDGEIIGQRTERRRRRPLATQRGHADRAVAADIEEPGGSGEARRSIVVGGPNRVGERRQLFGRCAPGVGLGRVGHERQWLALAVEADLHLVVVDRRAGRRIGDHRAHRESVGSVHRVAGRHLLGLGILGFTPHTFGERSIAASCHRDRADREVDRHQLDDLDVEV